MLLTSGISKQSMGFVRKSSYTVGGSRSFSMIYNRTNCITTLPFNGNNFMEIYMSVRSRAGSGSRQDLS